MKRLSFQLLLLVSVLVAVAGNLMAEGENAAWEAAFRNAKPVQIPLQQAIEIEVVLTNRSKGQIVIERPGAADWNLVLRDAKGVEYQMMSAWGNRPKAKDWPTMTLEAGASHVLKCELRPVSLACINVHHALFLPRGGRIGIIPVNGSNDWVYPVKLSAKVIVVTGPGTGTSSIATKEITLAGPGKGRGGKTGKPAKEQKR